MLLVGLVVISICSIFISTSKYFRNLYTRASAPNEDINTLIQNEIDRLKEKLAAFSARLDPKQA
jgi:hypothetical protein